MPGVIVYCVNRIDQFYITHNILRAFCVSFFRPKRYLWNPAMYSRRLLFVYTVKRAVCAWHFTFATSARQIVWHFDLSSRFLFSEIFWVQCSKSVRFFCCSHLVQFLADENPSWLRRYTEMCITCHEPWVRKKRKIGEAACRSRPCRLPNGYKKIALIFRQFVLSSRYTRNSNENWRKTKYTRFTLAVV